MKTGISEGFICPCGKKFQRTVFPNQAAEWVSCPCGGELIHLWTHKIEIMDGDFPMLTDSVFQHPYALQIMDEIRNRNEREKRMEGKRMEGKPL